MEESVHALSQQRAARMDGSAYALPAALGGSEGAEPVRFPAAAGGVAGGVLTVRDISVLLRLGEG